MNAALKQSILEHARAEAPRECCGLVVFREGLGDTYVPCRNIAKMQSQFIMEPNDYAAADELGLITAVVHSHYGVPAVPSQADLAACEASGLPWIIVSLPNETWFEFAPSGYRAPLVGREFSFGTLDCYGLIRDWYFEEHGVTLLDFDRMEDFVQNRQELYMDGFEKAGFKQVTDSSLERGDVIIMEINSKVANHGAIYVGNDRMLHHLQNRLSRHDVYGDYYRKRTRAVVRYYGT